MTDETNRKPFLDLSVTQLVGGSLAAATAAALGSRLGTVGTIVGASLVSVVSAVAGALYTQSLRRTQELIRARDSLGTRERLQKVGAVASRRPTLRDERHPDTQEIEAAVDDATPSIWSRITWKTVAVTAGICFVITALVVTGTELLTGHSLDGSSRTTVSHVVKGGSSPSTDTSTDVKPTEQPSTDPGGSTSAVPSADPSSGPTDATTVPEPTPTPTGVPSATTTPSPSATATP